MANILQVAYYRGPLVTRARMLESRGHHVTSVLGNDEAFRLDAAVIAAADSIVIGFSAPYPIRAAMIHWFKELHPNIPVVALQFHSAESFPEADGGTVSTTLRFGWRRSRIPSKNQAKRLSAPLLGAAKVSKRSAVNLYAFVGAALTITGRSQKPPWIRLASGSTAPGASFGSDRKMLQSREENQKKAWQSSRHPPNNQSQ